MALTLPKISMSMDTQNVPVVVIDDVLVTSAKELLASAPALQELEYVRVYANILNHLAHGYEYELIIDPAAFQMQYTKEYEAEDENEQSVPGLIHLHNYGVPSFKEIKSPFYEGDILIFYVRHNYLGVPYKATLNSDALPTYLPVAMYQD